MSKIDGSIELGGKLYAYEDIIGETSIKIQPDKNIKMPMFESSSIGNFMQSLTLANDYTSWSTGKSIGGTYIKLWQNGTVSSITVGNNSSNSKLMPTNLQTGYVMTNTSSRSDGAIMSNNKDNKNWTCFRLYRNESQALFGINDGNPTIERWKPNENRFNTKIELLENDFQYISSKGYAAVIKINDSDNHGGIKIGNSTAYLKWLRNIEQIQVRNNADNAYVSIAAGGFVNGSKKKFKENIEDIDDSIINNIVMDNDIKKYNLISEREEVERIEKEAEDKGIILDPDQLRVSEKAGLMLEDLTVEANNILHPERTEGIDMYAMISLLWRHNQIQQNKIDCLEAKLDMITYQINNL